MELMATTKWEIPLLFLSILAFFAACTGTEQKEPSSEGEATTDTFPHMQVAHLSQGTGEDFRHIQEAFAQRNPGYALTYLHDQTHLPAEDHPRVLFVQSGAPKITLSSGETSETTVGDIIVLEAQQSLTADSLMSVLAFQVPETPPAEIPRVIRPDWDPNITDVPGGCATETNAYRRILLTWKEEVGAYIYHDLNAHRVRIMDSFSHYHPQQGGFDEFYLVQMALPEARIITSNRTDLIINPTTITKEEASQLINETPLEVGDLVYLPRGVMHRGIGGVLAQVITVPGFIPGAEIGVDHHIRTINELLGLMNKKALPLHEDAADGPLIK